MTPLYSVGTWDICEQRYTPQIGAGPWCNLTLAQLRRALNRLRSMGYEAWRVGNSFIGHDSDPSVLVERTDGETEAKIMERWKR